MARRQQKERISLPWERHGGRWRGALRNPRWQALLALVLILIGATGFIRYTQHRIRVRNTEVAIAQLKQSIDQFRVDVGRCPRSNAELLHPPRSQKHYLDSMPKDGWGRPLAVRCPGYFEEEAEVISAGPSGSFLQDDNIQ